MLTTAVASLGSTPPNIEPEEPNQQKHCWECRRRRLVCDSTKPECKRCKDAEIECPGYSEKKPLRWVHAKTSQSRQSSSKKDTSKKRPKKDRDKSEKNLRVEVSSGLVPATQQQSSEVIDAIEYYNIKVYQDYASILQLVPKSLIAKLPSSVLSRITPTMKYILICLSLGHQIHQLDENVCQSVVINAWIKFYRFRGMIIRSLRNDISNMNASNYLNIMSCISFLLILDAKQNSPTNTRRLDVQVHQSYPDWQLHQNGISDVLQKVGGLEAILRPKNDVTKNFLILAHHCVNIMIFGNATSPLNEQCTLPCYDLRASSILECYWSGLTPQLMCPAHLVLDMLLINNLRANISTLITPRKTEVHIPVPKNYPDLLHHITSFSPAKWAEEIGTQDKRVELEALGSIHQAAVAVYCILSLLSANRVAATAEVETQRVEHSEHLLRLLRKWHATPGIDVCLLWPLGVAGVASAQMEEGDREFVAGQLMQLRRTVGQASPVLLKGLLERFWAGGRTEWDSCFDKPYFFCT